MEAVVTYSAAATMANFRDKQPFENEDFVTLQPKDERGFLKMALCDGAGGSGVFCGEWAAYLGEHVPANPGEIVTGEQSGWLEGLSRKFHDEVIAKQDLSDLILQRKVYYSGSYSTLSACWIDLKGNEIFFCGVGDSCIFYFEAHPDDFKLEYLTSIDQQNHIDAPPELLNWNEKQQKLLPLDSLALSKGFAVLLASDAVAKWILLNLLLIDFVGVSCFFNATFLASLQEIKYEEQKKNIRLGSNKRTIKELFGFLKDAMESNEKFESAMVGLADAGELEVDDYSLLILEGNVS